MVEEQFAPVPVRTIPFFDKEMVGIERLAELGQALFGDTDPHAVPVPRPALLGRRATTAATRLSVELPFTSQGRDLAFALGR